MASETQDISRILGQIEGRLAEHSARFDHIDTRLDQVNSDMAEGFRQVNADMAEGFRQVNSDMTEGLHQVNSDITEGFRQVKADMTEGFRHGSNRTDRLLLAIFGVGGGIIGALIGLLITLIVRG
jgi:BMFP domain-containing protein YqiC